MSFRVFVQVWSELDPTLNLRLDRQTGAPIPEEGDRPKRVSPLGRFGLAEALRLPGAEVTAFGLGEEENEALRLALASGAGRAIHIRGGPAWPEEGGLAGLTGWISAENPNLVIMDRRAGLVAAELGWAHLAGLDRLEIENGTLRAARQFGRGAYEKVAAKLPAIIRMQNESPRVRYVARARVAEAAARPIEEVEITSRRETLRALEIGPLQPARPRTRLGAGSIAAGPGAKAADRLSALMGIAARPEIRAEAAAPAAAKTPEEFADEFVRYLAHHQLLPA